MKKIIIDTTIIDDLGIIGGQAFTTPDGKKEITIRDALVNHCGMFKVQNGEDAIRAYDLGIKIKNADESIILEESDLEFLKSGPLNQPKYVAIVMAQIYKALDSAETIDPNE